MVRLPPGPAVQRVEHKTQRRRHFHPETWQGMVAASVQIRPRKRTVLRMTRHYDQRVYHSPTQNPSSITATRCPCVSVSPQTMSVAAASSIGRHQRGKHTGLAACESKPPARSRCQRTRSHRDRKGIGAACVGQRPRDGFEERSCSWPACSMSKPRRDRTDLIR